MRRVHRNRLATLIAIDPAVPFYRSYPPCCRTANKILFVGQTQDGQARRLKCAPVTVCSAAQRSVIASLAMGLDTVAVIGSFRQHNDVVQQVCTILRNSGIEVTSPVGANLVEEGIPFVRFSSDNVDWSDPTVQSLALHRILRASLTYVVAPHGYVGRTTCYEIGRLIQAKKPLYFSARPQDLPVLVANEFIVDATELVRLILTTGWTPSWLFRDASGMVDRLERDLLDGRLRQD